MKNKNYSQETNPQKFPGQQPSATTQSKIVNISTFRSKKAHSAKRETVEELAKYADNLDW